MRDDLSEENETDVELGRWQFRLRTLLLVTALVAVFCSMVAWLGAIIVTLVVAGAVGAFLGAWACPIVGLENPFGDLKWDVAKCFGVSTLFVGLAYGAIVGTGMPQLLLIVVMLHFFLLKLFWLELDTVEIVVIECGTIGGVVIAGPSIAHWLVR